jgi:pyruvate/2-oxoglutarate dehydrogenase complex dihydrolipoamide dehydrogenase (E3) component
VRRYDLAVVGGGTAGLVTAIGAAGLGARVVLVERHRTGGDCLWTGCVPSKSLIAAAELAHRIRTADAVGLEPREPEIDFAAVMGHVRAAQARIAPHDSPERLRSEGVEVVPGSATFLHSGGLAVEGRALAFRTAVIATGSEPVVPPIDGLQDADAVTTDDVWALEALPERLIVLGGGPVGCELAQAFARLGSRVAIVEAGGGLLPAEEPEAGALLVERFAGEGIDVRLEATATRAEPGGDRQLVLERAGSEERLPFDRVLIATGRRPLTAGLGLQAAGVEVTENGAVEVDPTLRTSATGIFAAGDVTGALPFTHVAAQQGRLVVPNALFHARRRFERDAVPWVTFTDPEVARVGLSETEARARHGEVVVERHDYAELDRAITAGTAYGFAKLVADARGRLLGATVAAPAGGEAIAELAARVRAGGKVADISQTVHAYPTFAEGPARAADEHLRKRFLNERTRRLTRPALAVLRLLDRRRWM